MQVTSSGLRVTGYETQVAGYTLRVEEKWPQIYCCAGSLVIKFAGLWCNWERGRNDRKKFEPSQLHQ